MEDIRIFAESIEDISVGGPNSLDITLAGVDVQNIIDEVGVEEILSYISEETIKEYLAREKETE